MYNSYLHHKLLKQDQAQLEELEKSMRSLAVQSRVRERLLKKYEFRTVKRVVDLAMNPVPVYNRESNKSPKFMGDSIMRLKPRDSKARIHDAVQQNVILDASPLPTTHNDFRPRNKGKEIQVDMKFTPKDRYQRLIEKWMADKEIIYSWEVNKASSKSPIRNTTKKLYYKSIEEVALNVAPETCSKDNSRVMLRQISEDSFWEDSGLNDKEKLGIVATSALERCNLRPRKDPRFMSSNRGKYFS